MVKDKSVENLMKNKDVHKFEKIKEIKKIS